MRLRLPRAPRRDDRRRAHIILFDYPARRPPWRRRSACPRYRDHRSRGTVWSWRLLP
jgi:hypothetical protein